MNGAKVTSAFFRRMRSENLPSEAVENYHVVHFFFFASTFVAG